MRTRVSAIWFLAEALDILAEAITKNPPEANREDSRENKKIN